MNEENNKFGYIYVRCREDFDKYDACKLGKTYNIPDRDSQYATGEIKRGYFESVYEVPIKQVGLIERLLQSDFKEYHIKKYDGGIEFFNKIIISLIENKLIYYNIIYKKLTNEEIKNLIRCYRIKNILNKNNINIKDFIKKLKEIKELKELRDLKNYLWNERDYQKNIIHFCKNKLLKNNKIYIDLPTGAGKSYIVYNLFNYINNEFIIIVSPRIIVNSQNISNKYLQLLKSYYDIFNWSSDDNFDEFLHKLNKKIIICCTQSINKLYNIILSNKIKNITIWFDEAHWGVEDWIIQNQSNNDNNNINNKIKIDFWLLDNIYIKYRIFTSASPDKNKVEKFSNVFGQLYSPIKIKELISLNWLAPIKTYIYSENKKNIDNIKYIINDFIEYNRKFGFSFHNKQKNAFNLFYKHYIIFNNKITNIKPFLLVSDNFTIEREEKLKCINLDYDYRNVKVFENNINSIGYVVAKYSMGYDFNKLDFMFFGDPKLSIPDIKQSIGRGIRPDQLGINGSNKDKELVISLPIYIDENEKDELKYDTILQVLKYLIYDVEIPFKDIIFKNRHKTLNKTNKPTSSNEYNGDDDITSKLLDLLEQDKKRTFQDITYQKAIKIIAEYNIKNKEDYYELCDKDNRLSKEPDKIFKGQFTNWIEYLSIERKYYDIETCKNKINEYLTLYPNIKKNYLDLSLVSLELSNLDNLFPPTDLWVEYYNVQDLRDIINISHKKKKIII